jgi:membrane associated rhomboid family serine protease
METVIRTTESAREADEWALVLTAAGIPYRLEWGAAGWMLLAPDPEVANVREALDAYAEETRGESAGPLPEAASARTAWTVGLAGGAFLLGFFAVTGPPMGGSPWFDRGAAAAGPMLHGEPWRAVTALTLHVDTVHVVSNAIATALLLPPIVQRLGPGGAVWLLLLAGTGANLLAATAQGSPHVAVGASTATFGAIGILAALRLWPRSGTGRTRGRRWIVPVATVLLLTMLGTGRGADVLAHALGLLSGGVIGLVAAVSRRRRAVPIQWALAAAAALTVVGCWQLALSGTAG